jgi:hypothetical protein
MVAPQNFVLGPLKVSLRPSHVADRARLRSLLARDQTPLMPDSPPMPDLSQRVQLPGAIRSQRFDLPPVLTIEDTVNPLTYAVRFSACQSD